MTRAWPGSVLLAGLLVCRGDTLAGALVGPVAGAVHEDLVAGVDEPVEQGFGHDRVGDLPRAFRTADLWLIHAADCCSKYSSWTCCGVRY